MQLQRSIKGPFSNCMKISQSDKWLGSVIVMITTCDRDYSLTTNTNDHVVAEQLFLQELIFLDAATKIHSFAILTTHGRAHIIGCGCGPANNNAPPSGQENSIPIPALHRNLTGSPYMGICRGCMQRAARTIKYILPSKPPEKLIYHKFVKNSRQFIVPNVRVKSTCSEVMWRTGAEVSDFHSTTHEFLCCR